jgi:hypothetical protein
VSEAELRASIKDVFIDVEMARCGIMEGVERIMVIIGRFERGAGESHLPHYLEGEREEA